jgi:hypothetical protein
MQNNKWINKPWTIGIGTALIGGLLPPIIYDYCKKYTFLTTIKSFLNFTYVVIFKVLNWNIKFWWILLFVVICLGVLYIAFGRSNENIKQPEFLEYKNDKFKKWRWSWEWIWDSKSNTWLLINLRAYCPKCDTGMICGRDRTWGSLVYECPRCEYAVSEEDGDKAYQIEKLIHDTIDRREKSGNKN